MRPEPAEQSPAQGRAAARRRRWLDQLRDASWARQDQVADVPWVAPRPLGGEHRAERVPDLQETAEMGGRRIRALDLGGQHAVAGMGGDGPT